MKTLVLLTLAVLVAAACPAEAEPTCQELPGGAACAEAGESGGSVVVHAEAEGVSVDASATVTIG